MNPLRELHRAGQSPWLDYIARELLWNGEISRMIADGTIRGITSNPSIFEKAISSSTLYDETIGRLAREGKEAQEIYDIITIQDVGDAADLLKEVYKNSQGEDGYVSIEVPPRLAYDSEGTVASARKLFHALGRQNILVKVPATREGLPAITRLIAEGINVNATLIFSLSHYRKAASAYLQGLTEREMKGAALGAVSSVASVFVSRIDTTVDKRLDSLLLQEKDSTRAEEIKGLRGKVAVANCKMVYHAFKQTLLSPPFTQLRNQGAKVQKIVWGSTSTKDPAYSDIKYVSELIGADTINTMPLDTLAAFKEHGVARATLEQELEEAKEVLARLERLGIDLEAAAEQIQEEGVRLFAQSFDALLSAIQNKARALG